MPAQPLWSSGRCLGQGLKTVLKFSRTPMGPRLSRASSRSKTPRVRWGRRWSARYCTWGRWPASHRLWIKVREGCGCLCVHAAAKCPVERLGLSAKEPMGRQWSKWGKKGRVEETSKASFTVVTVVCCSRPRCFCRDPSTPLTFPQCLLCAGLWDRSATVSKAQSLCSESSGSTGATQGAVIELRAKCFRKKAYWGLRVGRIEGREERIGSDWRDQEDFLGKVTSVRKALTHLHCGRGATEPWRKGPIWGGFPHPFATNCLLSKTPLRSCVSL